MMNPHPPLLSLVLPDIQWEGAYCTMMEDWKTDLEHLTPFTLREDYSDFKELVKRLKGYAKGENLNWDVPHHNYWALNAEGELVGTVNIRPHLTERLLKAPGHIGYGVSPSHRRRGYATRILSLSLEIIREMGVQKAMLSVEAGNLASARTIEANGGVFTRYGSDRRGNPIHVYWINC